MLHNLGTALSREQMKNVVGGRDEELDEAGGGAGCSTYCTGTAASNYQGGTCSSSSMPSGGGLPPSTICTCSVVGGAGC